MNWNSLPKTASTARGLASRFALAVLTGCMLLVCTATARAATYTYTLPSQTWNKPTALTPCSAGSSLTYATLTLNMNGTVTVTATRASGTGLSLTIYQAPFNKGSPCTNLWSTTTSGTSSVSASASISYSSQFVFVISGNSSSDHGDITVTATTTSGTSSLVCNGGTTSQDYFVPPPEGGSYSFTYTPPVGAIGCEAWTAGSFDTWVNNISPTSGTGAGTISFTVEANNTGGYRYSEISVGSSSVYVFQDGGPVCNYALSSSSASVAATASTGSVGMTADSGCAWTTSTTGSFVTGVTASGTGNGTINYNVAANTGPARSATISAGGQTYTINQASGCTYSLSASSASASATGGTASVTITPSNSACAWTASSNSGFLTGVTASGTGTGTVSYTVASNSSVARSGTLTIAGQTFTVNQASGCTFSVVPSSLSPAASASSGSLMITASNAACPWTAANDDSWLAVTPGSGTGSQSVTYDVAVNNGPARSGSLTVAGQTVSFDQASGCTASLSSSGVVIDGSGGSSSVTLTMSSPLCGWTASSDSSWVTVPASGTGSGTVTFTVAAQGGPARSATLTIAGQTFTVEQSNACSYALNPTSANVGAGEGSGSVTVTSSDPACPWTVASNAGWLSSSSSGGTGTQSVPYDYGANVGPSRAGTLTIAGQTFGVTQADGCTASASPSSQAVAAGGTSGTFTLTLSSPSCAWTASSSAGFISGVTASGTGSGSVAFTVAANAGPARSGTITAGGSTFTIDQASGCVASLTTTTASATASGGSGSIPLTLSDPACSWTATSNASWLGSVTASGTGSGSVAYTAAANLGPVRSGTITVAGQTFTVQQADGCSFTLSTTLATVPSAGGSGSINVTASDPACTFTASSADAWLTGVTPGGTGSTTIAYTAAANYSPARTGTLLIAGQSVSIQQPSDCAVTLDPTTVSLSANGGSATVNVTANSPTCTWTANANQAFISNLAFPGSGSGTVTFDVAPNVGIARSAMLVIGGETVSVTQADGCTFLLNPTGAELAPGGTGPFTLELSASDSSCPWTMQAADSWITVNTPSGSGSSTLSYSTLANVGPTRTSTIDVADRVFSVVQDDGCQADVTPSGTLELSADAQTAQFHLALSNPSCAWTATSSNSWLSVTDGAGTGDGDVHFSVEANTGPERTLQVQLPNGQTVTVHQASGCAVTLPSAAGSALASGGTLDFNVDTANGCEYTAETSDPWLKNLTVTAQGIAYDVDPSTEASRVGTITVKSTSTNSSADYTVTQANGCVFALSAGGDTPAAEGGDASFTVTTAAGCDFTATTEDTWLEPVTVSNGTVSYQVAANPGPARSGTIDITNSGTGATTTFGVSQASGCAVVLATDEVALDKDGGAGSFDVTTGPGCALDVSSPDAWLFDFTTDNGHVSFQAKVNADTTRDGTIVVEATDSGASATFTVHEDSGCSITLPSASAEIATKGGAFGFDVVTGSGCDFETKSDATWLENVAVTAGGVTFSATANSGVARTATITVTASDTQESASYAVHQSGPITKPAIDTQPKGAHLLAGDTLTLDVVASGGDLHYQWRKDGTDIAGARALEYLVPSATVDDSGSYDVVVSNDAGSVTSDAAVVVVTLEDGSGGSGTGASGGAAGSPGSGGTSSAGKGSSAAGGTGASAGTGGSGGSSATGGSGELPTPADQTNTSARPFVGGGSCTCSTTGREGRNLPAGAVALLFAAAFIARRRRSHEREG